SIDEEDESLGPGFGKGLESGGFIVERLNERMRHRAEYGNAVELAGGHRGCPSVSGDVAGPRRHETSLGSMGSPQAEVDELLAWRQQHMAGRLGCDQRLEMENIDQPAFDELSLRQWCDNAQNRLIGKEDRAFRHGVDITGEAEFLQLGDDIFAETPAPAQPVEVFRGKT